jgi:hypothetical protein
VTPPGGRRPGAGRKARAGDPAKNRTIRATDAEWALWQDEAAAAGLGISDWVRAACDALAARRQG